MRHIDELKLTIHEVWYQEEDKVKEHCKDLPICGVATDGLELIDSYYKSLKDHGVANEEEIIEGLKLILQIIVEKDLKEKPSLRDIASIVLKDYSVKILERKVKDEIKITVTADIDKLDYK